MDGTDFASFEIKMNLGGVFYDYEVRQFQSYHR